MNNIITRAAFLYQIDWAFDMSIKLKAVDAELIELFYHYKDRAKDLDLGIAFLDYMKKSRPDILKMAGYSI